MMRDGDDARAQGLGHGLRAIGRAVVGDQDFARNAAALQIAAGLANADLDGLRLVQAGHQNGQFDLLGHRFSGRL